MVEFDSSKSLVILEGGAIWKNPAKLVVYWDGDIRRDAEGVEGLSLAAEVEQRALTIRGEYLAWLASMPKVEIARTAVRDRYRLYDNLSLWWMSLIAESSPLKMPEIYDVFRLRTVEHLLSEHQCEGVLYCGSDTKIGRVLRDWCRACRRPYHCRPSDKGATAHGGCRRFWKALLPEFVQAQVCLARSIWKRYRLTGRLPPVRVHDHQKHMLVVSFFPNVDHAQLVKGAFYSHYWGKLHSLFQRSGRTVHWVLMHVHTRHPAYTPGKTRRLFDQLAQHGASRQHFHFLEEFLHLKDFFDAWRRFCAMYCKGLFRKPDPACFRLPGSNIPFFRLMEKAWNRSFYGAVAMESILFAIQFDRMAHCYHDRTLCLFLWENQAWENALIAAWKRVRRSPIIGHQHFAMAPLYVSFFASPPPARDGRQALDKPSCDIIAVNGQAAMTLLRTAGYDGAGLALSEAVRFLHLPKDGMVKKNTETILLLVLGMAEWEVDFQLKILEKAVGMDVFASLVDRVWIKPHPGYYPREAFAKMEGDCAHEIMDAPLASLWPRAGKAFLANSTSAAIEAAWWRIPLAVCGSGHALNLSPLYGNRSVTMIHHVDDFLSFLKISQPVVLERDYFILDDTLPRWRALLEV